MSDQYDDGYHDGHLSGYADGYIDGQCSKQCEINELTGQLDLMKGWEKIAQSNGEDKRKYLAEKDELVNRLKQLLNICKIQSNFGVYNDLDKGWVDAYRIVVDDIEQLLKDTEND